MNFVFLTKEIFLGKSVIRATLNDRLKKEKLSGKILDLGSGGSDRYSNFIPRSADSQYDLFDVKTGESINFETDSLAYADQSYDTVLLLNVLEHLYNTENILKEIKRIKKDAGVFIGYVPFLMWYHKDPHDYFRYTHEALEKMLQNAGYTQIAIEPIYRGPYTTAFQMTHTTIPRFIRPIPFALAWAIDGLFKYLKPTGAKRFVLGYYIRAI